MAPKINKLKTKINWLVIATPDICSVPTRPIMILSNRFTKFVIPFCTMIGTAIRSTDFRNALSPIYFFNMLKIYSLYCILFFCLYFFCKYSSLIDSNHIPSTLSVYDYLYMIICIRSSLPSSQQLLFPDTALI